MSRGSIADRTRLAAFAARRALRTGMGRLNAHPMLRWRFTSAIADRLLIAPQDLRTADPTRASEIYSGRFAFAGKIVICDGRSPFEIEPPSEEWSDQLLGFGWLRHLRAAESAHHARQCARAGRRVDLAAGRVRHRGRAGGPIWSRAASSRGSARRRWCCTTPTCGSTAASCATSPGRCAICAARYAATRDGVPRLQAVDRAHLRGAVHAGRRRACSKA